MSQKPITEFIEKYFLHFNAASLIDAANGYITHLDEGGKMMITERQSIFFAEMDGGRKRDVVIQVIGL